MFSWDMEIEVSLQKYTVNRYWLKTSLCENLDQSDSASSCSVLFFQFAGLALLPIPTSMFGATEFSCENLAKKLFFHEFVFLRSVYLFMYKSAQSSKCASIAPLPPPYSPNAWVTMADVLARNPSWEYSPGHRGDFRISSWKLRYGPI